MPKAWGGCFLVFASYQYAVTKKQPPARYARRPPSQEGNRQLRTRSPIQLQLHSLNPVFQLFR